MIRRNFIPACLALLASPFSLFAKRSPAPIDMGDWHPADPHLGPVDLDEWMVVEGPYPLNCFTHGGSPVANRHNEKFGFTCPECDAKKTAGPWRIVEQTDDGKIVLEREPPYDEGIKSEIVFMTRPTVD